MQHVPTSYLSPLLSTDKLGWPGVLEAAVYLAILGKLEVLGTYTVLIRSSSKLFPFGFLQPCKRPLAISRVGAGNLTPLLT